MSWENDPIPKKCPFCGESYEGLLSVKKVDEDYDLTDYYVNCGFCDGCGPNGAYPEDAVKKWNRRD
jgi:Lar family restriction alleviation protein